MRTVHLDLDDYDGFPQALTDHVSIVTESKPTSLREFIRRNRDALAG